MDESQTERPITPKERKFADVYLATGNKREATKQAYNIGGKGGSGSLNTIDSIARETHRKPTVSAYIEKRAITAARGINKLGGKAKSEMVRLLAYKDILDRAGYAPVKKVEGRQIVGTFRLTDLRREMEKRGIPALIPKDLAPYYGQDKE